MEPCGGAPGCLRSQRHFGRDCVSGQGAYRRIIPYIYVIQISVCQSKLVNIVVNYVAYYTIV